MFPQTNEPRVYHTPSGPGVAAAGKQVVRWEIHVAHRHGRRALAGVIGATMLALAGLLAATVPAQAAQTPPPLPAPSSNVTVVASGLENPRGLKFGPDGYLYVAEGGHGGTASTVGQCEQVPGGTASPGPYTGSTTGSRISRIAPDGTRTTAVDNIPSSQTNAATGGLTSGVTDMDWIGGTLYGLMAGSGCSHGVASIPNGVIKANSDGTWSLIADLSAFQMSHPVAHPEADDFEPDGSWYSMIAVNGDLYALEPNHGEVDKITTSGQISRMVDISASQGHQVPTSMVFHDGNFYIGNLFHFPIQPGSSRIFKVTPDGQVSIFATGLTTVLGVAFDSQGRLYATEMSTAPGMPTPGTGKVVRLGSGGQWETIASGLTFPTAMTFGPDGQLYLSHIGLGLPAGMGQIVRVALPGTTPPGMPTTGNAPGWPPALLLLGLLLALSGGWVYRASARKAG